MKTKIVTILAIGFVFTLTQCKDEGDIGYSSNDIVIDNVKAALYFHVVFREAEYAWAIVDSIIGYASTESYIEMDSSNNIAFKKYTYSDTTKIPVATVEYNEWRFTLGDEDIHINGSFTIAIDTFSYRVSRSVSTVTLLGFSINEQSVTGSARITCQNVESNENDIYSFNLLSGASIRKKGDNTTTLITASIPSGRYERVIGVETFTPDDDVWGYLGNMNGIMRENPKLNYTNTGDRVFYYSTFCNYAENGAARIEIKDHPVIYYWSSCYDTYYETVENIIR